VFLADRRLFTSSPASGDGGGVAANSSPSESGAMRLLRFLNNNKK